jgi:hypothetical protein
MTNAVNKTRQEQVLATGIAYLNAENYMALRAAIAFGFGAYLAGLEEKKSAVADYKADLQAVLLAYGMAKATRSRRVSAAMKVGERFAAIFGAHVNTRYANDADRFEACLQDALKAGADSVDKLKDWAEHGNPHFSLEKEVQDAQDKADKKAKAQEEAQERARKIAEGIDLTNLTIAPRQVQGVARTEPAADAAAVSKPLGNFDAIMAGLYLIKDADQLVEIQKRLDEVKAELIKKATKAA